MPQHSQLPGHATHRPGSRVLSATTLEPVEILSIVAAGFGRLPGGLADWLQEQFFAETRSAWGEVRPADRSGRA